MCQFIPQNDYIKIIKIFLLISLSYQKITVKISVSKRKEEKKKPLVSW